MKIAFRRYTVLTLALGATMFAPASAAGARASGQTFVYQVSMATDEQADNSNLPAGIRGQVDAQLAYAKNHPTVYVLTLSLTGVAPDGSASAHVSFTNSLEGASAVFARVNQFSATFTADGRLIPHYDPNRPMPTASQPSIDDMQNVKASTMAQTFAYFNTFAGGCAKRPHVAGDTRWRVENTDPLGMAQAYDFSVASVDANGVAAVTMKTEAHGSSAHSAIDGSGHYDSARGLVLDLQVVNAFSNAAPSGVSVSGTLTTDYALRP
jgi:hypothetical protein